MAQPYGHCGTTRPHITPLSCHFLQILVALPFLLAYAVAYQPLPSTTHTEGRSDFTAARSSPLSNPLHPSLLVSLQQRQSSLARLLQLSPASLAAVTQGGSSHRSAMEGQRWELRAGGSLASGPSSPHRPTHAPLQGSACGSSCSTGSNAARILEEVRQVRRAR